MAIVQWQDFTAVKRSQRNLLSGVYRSVEKFK